MKFIKKFHSALSFDFKKVTAMTFVKGCRPLVKIFVSLIKTFGLPGNFPSTVRVVISLLKTFWLVRQSRGVKGLVLYLKVHYVILQQAVSGYKIVDLTPLGARVARNNSGIPRCIPAGYRARVQKGEVMPIRVLLTLFSLYRVLTFPGIMKIGTVTSGYTGKHRSDLNYLFRLTDVFTNCFVPWDIRNDPLGELKRSGKSNRTWALTDRENFPISKSGPASAIVGKMIPSIAVTHGQSTSFSSSHSFVAICSAIAFWFPENDSLRKSLLYVANRTLSSHSHTGYFINQVGELITLGGINLSSFRKFFKKIPLGKIGLKTEAAGKVRVFAMLDCWSQWVLYPLHKFLFRILRNHPYIDGTFNQINPVHELIKRKPKFLASLDLSAATDRLPVILQIELLASLFPQDRNFSYHWGNLLVARPYFLKGKPIYYAVGQPMGGYSSWAMLAYTHHFIVQSAAWLSGVTPKGVLFKDYAILGDDCVIANQRVANQYLQILNDLGVSCGLAKSILSQSGRGLEFAKRTFVLGHDVSPVSLQDFSWVTRHLSNAVEFAVIHKLSLPRWMSVLGYGYKILGSLNRPFNKMSGTVRTLVLSFKFQDLGKSYFNLLQLRSIQGDTKTLPLYLMMLFLTSEAHRLGKRIKNSTEHLARVSRNAMSSGSLWSHPVWWTELSSSDLSYLDRQLSGLVPGSEDFTVTRYIRRHKLSGLLLGPDKVDVDIIFSTLPGISSGICYLLLNSYMTDIVKAHKFGYFLDETKARLTSLLDGVKSLSWSYDECQKALLEVDLLVSNIPTHNPLGFNAHGEVKTHRGQVSSIIERYDSLHKAIITGKVTNKVLMGGFPMIVIFKVGLSLISKLLKVSPIRKILIGLPALRLLVLMVLADISISVMIFSLIGVIIWVFEVGLGTAITITWYVLAPYLGVILAFIPIEIKDIVLNGTISFWAIMYPYMMDVVYGAAAGSSTYILLSLFQDREIIMSSFHLFASMPELQNIGLLDGGFAMWLGYVMALSQDLFKIHILEPVLLPWFDIFAMLLFEEKWFSEATKLIAEDWFTRVPRHVLGVILIIMYTPVYFISSYITDFIEWNNEFQITIILWLLGLN